MARVDTNEAVGGAAPAPRRDIVAALPWWLLVPAILAPGLVVFVFPMVSLVSRNEEYFGGAYRAGRPVYLAGLVTVLIGIGLWAVRRTRVGRPAFLAYLLVTPAYVVYSVFTVVPRTALAAIVALLTVGAVVLMARANATRAVRAVAIVSAAVLVANGASAFLEAQNPPSASAAGTGPTKDYGPAPPIDDRPSGASLPNVYHVILDEFQTEQFELAADADDRAALAGFTWFPDATTTYGRTDMAVADMFSAEAYDYTTVPYRFVSQALIDPSSSIQQLRAAGYDTTGFIPNRSTYAKLTPFDEIVVAADAARSDRGSDDADLATSIWVDATLPDPVSRRIIPAGRYEQLRTGALLPDDEAAIAVLAFRSFVHREAQLTPTGRYTLVHLINPHHPYVLDPDCGHTPGAPTDGVAQAGCALTLVDELVDELKALGRFDSSTIVIHGDHGAGLARDGEKLVGFGPDVFGLPFSTGRSRPLLLVKPAGTDASAPMAISDRPAMTTDVMATIFDSVDLPFEATSGRASLIGDDFPDRPERYYHFYDRADQGLPAELVRYVIADGVLRREDESIPLPAP